MSIYPQWTNGLGVYPGWVNGVVQALIRWFITLRTIVRYGMAEHLDIDIQQGDSFDWEITVLGEDSLPMDLTGCTVRGMGRGKYKDVDPLFTFQCTVAPDQVANKGLITVELTDTITSGIPANSPGKFYVYDIELVTTNNKVKKLYRGNATVVAEATK